MVRHYLQSSPNSRAWKIILAPSLSCYHICTCTENSRRTKLSRFLKCPTHFPLPAIFNYPSLLPKLSSLSFLTSPGMHSHHAFLHIPEEPLLFLSSVLNSSVSSYRSIPCNSRSHFLWSLNELFLILLYYILHGGN